MNITFDRATGADAEALVKAQIAAFHQRIPPGNAIIKSVAGGVSEGSLILDGQAILRCGSG